MTPAKRKELTIEQRISNIEFLLKLFGGLSGVSLVALLGFAFWLGSISTKVSTSSDTINRVYGSVSENKDSLQVRTSVIESKLTNIDANITSINSSLNKMNEHFERLLREDVKLAVKPVPGPEPTPKQ